jgi:signal transduction histidine kinase
MKTRWLLVLAGLGMVLLGWLVWAVTHTASPPWPVLLADLIAVGGLAVGPWLVLVGRQLVQARDRDTAGQVYSRVVVVVVALAVGGPLAAAVMASGVAKGQPAIPAVLGVVSILSATLVALVGAVMLPWFLLLTRTISRERSARVRAEERAGVAAHLHDSVLQALTLMQKQADDSRSVRRLARGTERELRTWLYGTQKPTTDDLAHTVRVAAEDVEDRFDLTVELIAVGTCRMDPRAQAVAGAVREALTNAGKHAGVQRVSLLIQVADAELFALVRDRGRGFDRTLVPADRRGIVDSIEGRMRTHGGSATVRSAVGTGTEVELRMSR